MPVYRQIRRAADRAVTTTPWLNSRHSFSFGDHYDPANTHHGLLLVNNDDIVAPAAGFDTHPHRDMEIVTWVLEARWRTSDSVGNRGVIYPGLAQRMSAGSGITHSEKNASDSDPVQFVQMWVQPDVAGIDPGYQQQVITDGELDGVWRRSRREYRPRRRDHHPQPSAALHVARLQSGDGWNCPARRICTCSSPADRSMWSRPNCTKVTRPA